ncbi:MAG: GNAT family N-acetyltransferase [Candidatus Latescibacteria bacterium]|nr:GNAT family N-acetyltransferase [Candidatus Latescibacterota bacterium]
MDETIQRIIQADLNDPDQRQAVLAMVRSFSQAVTGEDLPAEKQDKLINGLKEHPAALVFIAFGGEDPIGLSVCFLGFSTFMARPLINIHDFYVEAAYRGRGIGRSMLQFIEGKALALDCCKLTLEVETNNQVALGLYHSFGFAEVEYDAAAGPVLFRQKVLA